MVVWTGILSDWELSKPVDTEDTASRATQADRMVRSSPILHSFPWTCILTTVWRQGTYEFMSVNLLNHIAKPVRISDELESFFHVLVYYAVRHLRSNCPNATSWIDNYFYRYSGPERMLTCGQKSYALEVTGMLQIRSPEGPLLFHSPLDGVLATILESLHAHYKVAAYDFAKAHPPPPPSRHSTPSPSPPSVNTVPIIIRDLDFDDVDDAQIAQWEAELDTKPRDDSPTPRDRALAKNVVDHKFMLDLLLRAVRDTQWCSDDRVSNSVSERASLSTPTAKSSGEKPSDLALGPPSSKRQRTSGPERNVSLPARLRATTRRARTNARTHPIRARR